MTKDMDEPEEEEIIEDGHTDVEVEDRSSDKEITDPFDPTKFRMSTYLMTIDQWPDGFFDEWDKSLESLILPGNM